MPMTIQDWFDQWDDYAQGFEHHRKKEYHAALRERIAKGKPIEGEKMKDWMWRWVKQEVSFRKDEHIRPLSEIERLRFFHMVTCDCILCIDIKPKYKS